MPVQSWTELMLYYHSHPRRCSTDCYRFFYGFATDKIIAQ